MKKFPFILVCALVFVSCSEKNNISNSVSSESSEITTETVVPIIQPERVVSKSGFNITSNGIEIIQRGEVSQVLEDTNLWDSFKYCGYVPDAGDILIRKDYDGDGYTDLCIPYLHKYSETKSETKNVYYHFNP
ncbi:MAG: hypothetical protein K2H19_08550, partial [Ruminococcus sp.]|nr:hypothetical protein [Ruminococcus sp.]